MHFNKKLNRCEKSWHVKPKHSDYYSNQDCVRLWGINLNYVAFWKSVERHNERSWKLLCVHSLHVCTFFSAGFFSFMSFPDTKFKIGK